MIDEFQSTPSTQRETNVNEPDSGTGDISIHSLYAEGDLAMIASFAASEVFQSTPSTQRETFRHW